MNSQIIKLSNFDNWNY